MTEIRVRSGHARPHIEAMGLDASEIEDAIRRQVATDISGASMTGEFWGRLTVQDIVLEYRAFTLDGGTIYAGTYCKAGID